MDLKLEGKVVLVTGGSRGIGRQIALSFAAEGAHVAICARSQAQLSKVAAEIAALGARVHIMVADLFRAQDCLRVVDETASVFGRLDVLVNNASTDVAGTLLTTSDEQLMERLNGKLLGAMRCSRAAVAHMRKVGGGRIICMGGISARNVSSLPSGMGNAALSNFAKNFSDEVAAEQILVNVVHPSFCKTDRFDPTSALSEPIFGSCIYESMT